MFSAFNQFGINLVWRYYPKQKEYKIEDLILESNMEVVLQPTFVTFLSSCDHGFFLGSKLQERTNGSSFTRLPSCKLKLADLCREVMEPQGSKTPGWKGAGFWGVRIFPLERWGTSPLDLKFGGGPQKI